MEYLMILLLLLVLLLIKGFFSGSEIALVSTDKIKLRHKAKTGNHGARLAMDMLKNPEVLLSTTLIGTNIATITLSTLGTVLMIELFGGSGDLWAFLLFTPLLLIFGEIVPKSVYQQKSETLTPVIIFPLRWFSMLLTPLVFLFSRSARLASKMFGGGRRDQPLFITREQLQSLVEISEHSTLMSAIDRGQIKRVIRFGETTVAEAMIPIAEVTAIRANGSTQDAITLVRKFGYNRLPVYSETTMNIDGIMMLTTWDMMDEAITAKPLRELVRPALFVSPLQTIDQLMPLLQKRDDHMAIVVDEFGATVGMITLEDIVEEVVGEIDVGYDFEEYLPKRKRSVEPQDNGGYLVDGRLPIYEADELLGIHLGAPEFHTVGGMMVARLKHIPKTGEHVIESGYRFTVEKANQRTVLQVRIDPEV